MRSTEVHEIWVNKNVAFYCHECTVPLGVTHWKHHCRSCGQIFCASCTSFLTRVPLEELCSSRPARIVVKEHQRCCFDCHLRIRAHAHAEDTYVIPQWRMLKRSQDVQILETENILLDNEFYHTNLYAKQL
jgi:hypothetical protein